MKDNEQRDWRGRRRGDCRSRGSEADNEQRDWRGRRRGDCRSRGSEADEAQDETQTAAGQSGTEAKPESNLQEDESGERNDPVVDPQQKKTVEQEVGKSSVGQRKGRAGRPQRLPSKGDSSKPKEDQKVTSRVTSHEERKDVQASAASATVSTTSATVPQTVVNKSLTPINLPMPTPTFPPRPPLLKDPPHSMRLEHPDLRPERRLPPRDTGDSRRRPDRRRGGLESSRGEGNKERGRRGSQRGRSDRERDEDQRNKSASQPSANVDAEHVSHKERPNESEKRDEKGRNRPLGERGREDQPSAEKGWGEQPSAEKGWGEQPSTERGRGGQPSGERGRGDQLSKEKGRRDQASKKDQPSGERRKDLPSGERGRGDQPSGERRGSRRGEKERRERGRGPTARQASGTTEDSVGTTAVDENQPQDQHRRDSGRRDRRRKDSKRDRGSRPSEPRGSERPSREARDLGRPGRRRERDWGPDRPTKPSPAPDEKRERKLDAGYGDVLEEITSGSDWEEQVETDQKKEGGEKEREASESHVVSTNWASGRGRAQRKKDERQELSESLGDEHRPSMGRGRGRGGEQGRGRSGRPGSLKQGASRQGDKSESVQEIDDSPSTSWERVPNRKGDGKPQPEKPSVPHKQQEFEKYDLNSTRIAIVDDMEGQLQVEEVEDTDEFVEVTSKKAQKEKVKKEREEQLKQELKEEQKKNRRLATTKSSNQTTTAQLTLQPSTAWTSKGEAGEGPSPHANIWSTTGSATSASDWNMVLRSAPGSAAPGSQLKESSSWPAMAVGGGVGVGVIGEGLVARPTTATLPSQTDHLTATTGNTSYSLFPVDPSLSSFISARSYGGSGGMLSAAVNLKLSQEHISASSGQEALSTSAGQPPSPGHLGTVDVEPVAQVQGTEREQLAESASLTSQEKGDEEAGPPLSHSKSSLPPRLHSTRANLSGGVGRGRGSIRGRKVERSKKGTESEWKDRDVPGEIRRESHRRAPDKEKVRQSIVWVSPSSLSSLLPRHPTGHFQQVLRPSS